MLFIASDHAGFSLKTHLKKIFPHLPWRDLGCHSKESVDYPDFADELASQMSQNPEARGLLICGSGQGMAMRANKYPHLRAALCWDESTATLSREHNDANVLCLGARLLPPELCEKILQTFLQTHFLGDRHTQRVEKIKRRISL